MKKYLLFVGAIFCTFIPKAFALPEMARYGQFSCISCHTSPGGGGMLTSHGRDFAEEKLATWHYDGEGDFLHGLVPTSDHYLVGGDARWVNYQGKTADTTFKKFWRMQTDLEVGVHFGPAWLTGMMGTSPAGPTDDQRLHSNLVHRGYQARVDLFDEHLLLRAGLFTPRYGLMLADHTAFVRTATGLNPDDAQTQVEAIYQGDMFEFGVAGLVANNMYDRKGKTESGYNLSASAFILGKNRINLNMLSTKLSTDSSDMLVTNYGISGVLTFTRWLYGMFEIDRIRNNLKFSGSEQQKESLADYFSINAEPFRGFFPYLHYEFLDSDTTLPDTSTGRWGVGASWHPRAHFQFEARMLRSFANSTHSTTDETDAIIHYYF